MHDRQHLKGVRRVDTLRELKWNSKICWAYAYYQGNQDRSDPLRVLAAQLAHATTLYGQERADYAAYLR